MFDEKLLAAIGEQMKEKQTSIAVAESVTSGLLQAAFSTVKDASHFFQGGITVYNIGQKCRHLLVEPLHAIASNCVSQNVAKDLGKNVCTLFTSHYGIGIVGYAAAMPEKGIEDTFAYYTIYHHDTLMDAGKITTTEPEGLPAQLYFAHVVLEKLLTVLKRKE